MSYRNTFRPAAHGNRQKTAALLLGLAALSFSGTAAAATFTGIFNPDNSGEESRYFDFGVAGLSDGLNQTAYAVATSSNAAELGWQNSLTFNGVPAVLYSITPDRYQYYQGLSPDVHYTERYTYYGEGEIEGYSIYFSGPEGYRNAGVQSFAGGFAESGNLYDSLTKNVWVDRDGYGGFESDTYMSRYFNSSNGYLPTDPEYDGTDTYSTIIGYADGRDGVESDAPFDAVGLADELKGLLPFSGFANFDFDRSWVIYEGSDEKVALSSVFGSDNLSTFYANSYKQDGSGYSGSTADFSAYWTSDSRIAAIELAYNAAAVPEPETWAMLLAGLGLMGAVSRRRARAA